MNENTVLFAIAKAERFMEVAKRVRGGFRVAENDVFAFGSKDTATLRRASMDLTRALSNMRKPF